LAPGLTPGLITPSPWRFVVPFVVVDFESFCRESLLRCCWCCCCFESSIAAVAAVQPASVRQSVRRGGFLSPFCVVRRNQGPQCWERECSAICIRQQHLIITVLLAVPALKYVTAFLTTFLCINYFALLFPNLFPFQSLLCCFLVCLYSNLCSSAVASFSSILTFALRLFPYFFPFEPSLCRFLVCFHSIPAFAWLFSCFFPFKPRSGDFLYVSIWAFLCCFLVCFHSNLCYAVSCLFPFQPLHCCFLVCFHSHLALVFSCLFPFQSCCYFLFSFGSLCGFVCLSYFLVQAQT